MAMVCFRLAQSEPPNPFPYTQHIPRRPFRFAYSNPLRYRATPWYSEKVLVEERGPVVARRGIPANSGALGERGNLAEIAEPDSG